MKKLIIFFIIIFQIINNIKCQKEPYSPVPRRLHTATLVGKKIYFLGGVIKQPFNGSNDFFYLDVSKSFDTSEKESIPYVDLTNEVDIPPHGGAAASVFAKDSIFLFGGQMGSNNVQNKLAFSYNTTQQKWDYVTALNGIIPKREMTMNSVTDNNNKVYIFGGGFPESDPTLGKTLYKYSSEMKIFDTVNKVWNVTDSGLPGRDGHTATYLPDTGDIVYIGGFGISDLTNLDVYNTSNNSWRQVTTKNPPNARYGHASVLTNDGRIIVFGGSSYNNSFVSENGYYEVLDTKTYEWQRGYFHGYSDRSITVPIMHHTATLYKDYLFVAFGFVSNDRPLSDDLLIYKIGDYGNFTLVNNFVAAESENSINVEKVENIKPIEPNIGITAGAIISIALGITTFGLVGFITTKWYKKTRIPEFEHALNT